jgi:hypothetical protein
MNWTGVFSYRARHREIDSVLNAAVVPVTHFSVNGGAQRVVDLGATDDISFVIEFAQARNYKNISLYLPPARNFEWLDLTEVAMHGLPLSISFSTAGTIGEKTAQTFELLCENARITEPPSRLSDVVAKTLVLVVRLSLPETKILHGSLQGGNLVETEE